MKETDDYKDIKANKLRQIYFRVDEDMLTKLKYVRHEFGISFSEIAREALRRLFKHIDDGGNVIDI